MTSVMPLSVPLPTAGDNAGADSVAVAVFVPTFVLAKSSRMNAPGEPPQMLLSHAGAHGRAPPKNAARRDTA